MNGYIIQKELTKMIKCILMIFVIFSSIDSAECNKAAEVKDYFGKWKVTEVKKYRGGLTEESDAKKFIGKFITVYKHEYVSVISTLKSPKYKINEVNVSIEEGIVPSALQRQVSTFYGYKIERKKILLFEIYDTSDGEESKYSHCEVLDNDTLLFSYDGWWIFTKRQSK